MKKSTALSDTKSNQLGENQVESGEIEFEDYSTAQYVTGSTAATGTSISITASPSPISLHVSKKQLRPAILAHIQAIRALGRTEINTQEIADALCISVHEVNDTVEVLTKQGVRRR
jgi:hypothetical protein